MKHLKYFENKNELKKYLILKDSFDMFYIFEYISTYKDILLKRLYNYYSNVNILQKAYPVDYKTLNIRQIKNNLLYESDNLQDCIDKLPTLKNINKYNL